MQVCIQDHTDDSCYLIPEIELNRFAAGEGDRDRKVDVLLVCPSDTLIQELPASRMSDSDEPTVQIVGPDGNRNWIIDFSDLKPYAVPTPPADADDVVWFALPAAQELLTAVPLFRRALLQHGC